MVKDVEHAESLLAEYKAAILADLWEALDRAERLVRREVLDSEYQVVDYMRREVAALALSRPQSVPNEMASYIESKTA